MIGTLKVLRQAGFFKEFAQLSDDEVLAEIHKKRKQAYSKVFGYDYEPEKILDDHRLAAQDTTKMIHLDLEADVCRENKVYAELLQKIDKMSETEGLISDIEEVWESETGPITVRCNINGEAKKYHPEYVDDWVDQSVLETILAEVSAIMEGDFLMCQGPNFEWFGQDVTYIRLIPNERKILQEELGWKFDEEFAPDMDF